MISKFFDSQNQPKSDFDAILLENRSFSGLGVNRKVVDNGLFYLDSTNHYPQMFHPGDFPENSYSRSKLRLKMTKGISKIVVKNKKATAVSNIKTFKILKKF